MGILTGPDGMGVEYSAFMAQMIGEEVLHEGVRLVLQLVSHGFSNQNLSKT